MKCEIDYIISLFNEVSSKLYPFIDYSFNFTNLDVLEGIYGMIITYRPHDLGMPDTVQFLEAIADFLAVGKLSVIIADFSIPYFKCGAAPHAGALL